MLNSYLRRDGIVSYNVFPVDAFTGKHESDDNGNANSHEYVDLGLKDSFGRTVYWATCNIGAEKPEDFGLYFAWGDTKGYGKDVNDGHIFDWSSYKWCKGDSMSITKYCFNNKYGVVDYKMILDLDDDDAHVNWGGGWHMPTKMEQTQLINECTWRWTSVNGVNGHEVKGPNGNSIFLPAAGLRTENEIYSSGVSGWYSSSSLDEPNHIFSIIIRQGGGKGINSSSRTNGRTIRPVLH